MPFATPLPSQFGRYRILCKLGEGGMGAVYLAEDTQLHRHVALKVPHFSSEDGPEVIERFYREARAAARIQHPDICTIYDVGQIDGIHYFTMPFIEGTPLSQRLQADQPWPARKAAALVLRLATALHVMHQYGLMHRDLKPGNIMLRPGDEPMVMDFGLARSVTQSDRVTLIGILLGTPAYMSPEQVLADPKTIGPATDIYSLGVICYQLFTGQLPFPGPGPTLFAQILHAEAELPSAHRPGLGPQIDAICQKAMAKQPGDRYASMAEFAADLKTYLLAPKTRSSDTPRHSKGPAPADAPETIPYSPRRLPSEPLVVASPLPQDLVQAKVVANTVGMQLRRITANTFSMGSDQRRDPKSYEEERPRHEVSIRRSFFLAVHKTTQGQFAEVLGRNPSWFSARGGGKDKVAGLDTTRFPIEYVTWYDAIEFCNRLSQREDRRPCYRLAVIRRNNHGSIDAGEVEVLSEGTGYRLPSEAEWEFCARASTTSKYAFGDDAGQLGAYAWFEVNSDRRTHPVGEKKPNPWGLYDLGGLVWEWCEDVWHADYVGAPIDGSAWRMGGEQSRRVVRGGSWNYPAKDCRCADRSRDAASNRSRDVGFRVVLVCS